MKECGNLVGKVRNLSVRFGNRMALKSVNSDLHGGILTIIVGKSGSGKTTFLRALNRLNEVFPDSRTEGSVSLKLGSSGLVNIYDNSTELTDLRRRVGMVFQNPNVLPISIKKNITLPLKLVLNVSGEETEKRIEESLKQVWLWEEVKDRLNAPAGSLSGGQQQRLCLARALALKPDFLLLDEPTSSLDYRASAKIEALLSSLKNHYNIIAVSHSLSQARRIGDLVVVFKDGTLVRSMSREQIEDGNYFHALVDDVF